MSVPDSGSQHTILSSAENQHKNTAGIASSPQVWLFCVSTGMGAVTNPATWCRKLNLIRTYGEIAFFFREKHIETKEILMSIAGVHSKGWFKHIVLPCVLH